MPTLHPTPREIADRQLIAYNARDLEAFLALHAQDAVLTDLPTGKAVCRGQAEMRPFYAERFANPNLYCRVHAKLEIAGFAVDRETLYGVPGGPFDILALYQVTDGLIRRVFFLREPAALPWGAVCGIGTSVRSQNSHETALAWYHSYPSHRR